MRLARWGVLPVLAGSALLAGCNNYPVLRVTGYEQTSFNNKADVLFVIDNSGSMRDNESQMALNFASFLGVLTSAEGSNVAQATLSDAVNNYLRETTGADSPVDYQLAITTTSVEYTNGESTGIDPGEAGSLIGSVIHRDDEDVEGAFKKQLLCSTIYWNSAELGSDPTYTPNSDGTCPDPGDEVSKEYLDCMCGGTYNTHEGSGNEEGLEAALEALCRAQDNPPADCFTDESGGADLPISSADEGSNDGLLRDDATTLVVIVSDEGDGSRRLATADNDPTPYLDIFSEFQNPVRFAVIGPPYHDQDGSCLDGAQTWGVERYQGVATESGGAYYDLTAIDAACTPSDWSENLEQLGNLLQNLLTVFPLQAIPDVSTIRVYVDGAEVAESAAEGDTGLGSTVTYGDGWTYETSENAVVFHGDAVPGYNADVRIYYKPLGGMPRSLPF